MEYRLKLAVAQQAGERADDVAGMAGVSEREAHTLAAMNADYRDLGAVEAAIPQYGREGSFDQICWTGPAGFGEGDARTRELLLLSVGRRRPQWYIPRIRGWPKR